MFVILNLWEKEIEEARFLKHIQNINSDISFRRLPWKILSSISHPGLKKILMTTSRHLWDNRFQYISCCGIFIYFFLFRRDIYKNFVQKKEGVVRNTYSAWNIFRYILFIFENINERTIFVLSDITKTIIFKGTEMKTEPYQKRNKLCFETLV